MASKWDSSLFICSTRTHTTFVLVYVDDILVTRSSKTIITQLISTLNKKFSLRDLGQLNYFLGIEVNRTTNGSLHLSQTRYIKDLLTKAKMHGAKGVSSPMTLGQKLQSFGNSLLTNPSNYRSIVGALQYLTITRPKLAFYVHKVCQFMHSPRKEHWTCVKRILRYLNSTLSHGLLLQPASPSFLSIRAFCDAEWGADLEDRRSISGFYIYLGPNLISWSSKK